MSTFSSEQLNLLKFASVILDEFPTALRHVFVRLWDTKVAPTPSFKAWDDSLLVRNMFLSKEGGKTKKCANQWILWEVGLHSFVWSHSLCSKFCSASSRRERKDLSRSLRESPSFGKRDIPCKCYKHFGQQRWDFCFSFGPASSVTKQSLKQPQLNYW